MSDIEKAKILLKNGDYTCVLCLNETTYTEKSKGIAPMINFLNNGVNLEGFSVADKIVGKAAAMLFLLAKIKCVYADVISTEAAQLLMDNGIVVESKTQTEKIINRQKTDICPMEKAVKDAKNPNEAYILITEKLNQLRKENKK